MTSKIAGVYDEVEIEDLDFDEETGIFTYPCPCGDKFLITLDMIKAKMDIGTCPSCSLTIRVIFDEDSYKEYEQLMEDFKNSQ
ncbi:hypothetical protein ABPG72_000401 [Tetrahymena utriculariae]